MKRLLISIIIITALIMIHQSAMAAEGLKIGILDLQRCIDQSNEGKRKHQTLKEKRDEMQKRLNEKESELLEEFAGPEDKKKKGWFWN